MRYVQIAPRYSRALLMVAQELGKVEEYRKLLVVASEVYKKLKDALDNPTISAEKRCEKLVKVLESMGFSVDKPFKNFLTILFEKKRQKAFPLIVRYFELMEIEFQMKVPVVLVMPYEPSDEELKVLKAFVQRYTKREPVFDLKIDQSLIAGSILEFEGKKLDISVTGRLKRIIQGVLEKR
ncbi:F0F1 ATP synthase subunit delta [Pseudothermotoga thermarum]|uniref:ATP synthase subunit delta n=1 Tax=Pseudothermotoga thermarum DSM 5069 TaxID=688269 RepID=F7YV82_9THEM|nr:F0F1 ATP synthase subunit delta [Pseudothermotoga thermarum]AEH50381.1 ATP synthase F1, delta subunit [Pseudothermotoga thermarum DSM 5069]